MTISIIGGGLAGSEAAWQIARRGITVKLFEMKPHRYSPAHKIPDLGELVCSNSLRSSSPYSAAGLLKAELRSMDSLIMSAADATAVPAGKALAVDRDRFADFITRRLAENSLITIERKEVANLPKEHEAIAIVATGPLTSDTLARDIAHLLGSDGLSFYDAIAPIIAADSIDMHELFRASRYGESEGDYLNAPLDEQAYRTFVQAILDAEKVEPHPFERIPHFEGCLPIEELARRGPETLAYGPMKPVGLVDPATGRRPYAVVQLRAENREETLYNLVGFQTKMTYRDQERVFRTIPGLAHAEFIRLGSVHRNTYLDAPRVLDAFSRATKCPNIFFAGQITGVEGYIESTASGLVVGTMAGLISKGITPEAPPSTTAMGALMSHTRQLTSRRYEPMNINFGIIDSVPGAIPKKQRKDAMVRRALEEIGNWKIRMDDLWQNAGA